MKTDKTTKGFAVLSAATLVAKMLSLIYVPLLVSAIDNDGFGIYYAAYSVFVFIYIVTTTGIPIAISKQVSELISLNNHKDAIKTFKLARTMLIIMGALMTILMFLFAGSLSSYIGYEEAKFSIMALSPTILFSAIRSSYMGYFQGQDNMSPRAISQIIEQVVNVFFSLLFAFLWIDKGIAIACMGATLGTPIGAFVTLIYYNLYYNKNKKIKIQKNPNITLAHRYSNKRLIARIIRYTIPITICWGLQYLGNLYETKILKLRLLFGGFSDTTSSLLFGSLGKYTTLINVPITIITSLSAAVLPLITRAIALENKKDIKESIDYSFRTTFLISFPSAVGLMVLSKPIYNILGSRFSVGYELMTYGAIALVLLSLIQIQTTILQCIGKLYNTTFNMIIGIIIRLIVDYNLVGIYNINIYGAIIGSYLGYFVTVVLNNFTIKKWSKVKFSLLSYTYKPLISSMFMGVCSFISYFYTNKVLITLIGNRISNITSTIIGIIIGIISYGYFMIIIGGINKNDIENLPNRMKKLIPKFFMVRIK